MLDSKKRIFVSLSFLGVLFLALIGITYAYFATNVTGNKSTDPSLKFTSGNLSFQYTDNESPTISGGYDGTSTKDLIYTKSFTIKNTGVATSYFGISISDYKVLDSAGNKTTFTRPNDWTYVLKSGNEIIKTGTFPNNNDVLITAYPLEVNEEKEITLIVTWNYITESEATDLGLSLSEVNQSADMNKTLSFNVSVTRSLDNLESAEQGTLLYALNENVVNLQSAEDDYGTSYYFQGEVDNNFVNYSEKCWRILRVQGDGTIKLILADDQNECNSDSYKLDNNASSYIFPFPEVSYNVNYKESELEKKLNEYLATIDQTNLVKTEYYSEHTIAQNNSWGNIYDGNDFNLGTYEECINSPYANQSGCFYRVLYKTGERYGYYYDEARQGHNLDLNKEFTTTLKRDVGTISLENAIGLITADEAQNTINNNLSFLTANAGNSFDEFTGFWTMTPAFNEDGNSDNYYYAFYYDDGTVTGDLNGAPRGIRPVIAINRKSLATTSTDIDANGLPGTKNNPYIINGLK